MPEEFYSLRFKNLDEVCRVLGGLELGGSSGVRPEGWVVVRVTEELQIVEAQVWTPSKPRARNERRAMLLAWQQPRPDDLVAELDYATLQSADNIRHWLRVVAGYFDERKMIRVKPAPWDQQEFLDAEAALGGMCLHKFFPLMHRYAPELLKSHARAGRPIADVDNAAALIRHLNKVSYEAGDQLHSYLNLSWWRRLISKVSYERLIQAWLERMEQEAPGFSSWVYEGARKGGFFASR